MLSKIQQFVKAHLNTIILISIVGLLVLLSFGAGYIMANWQNREPIELINPAD